MRKINHGVCPSGWCCGIMSAIMKNVLLTIEYDGTNFSGWQRQPGRRTVQGELERVLSVLCKQEITVQGTSRTDAGVHAYGQRACFQGEFGIPTDRIPVAANHLLAGEGPYAVGDVRIREAREVDVEFHPRFDALGKKYIYKIRNAPEPDILQRNYAYQIEKPLELDAMKQAATHLVGEQDFRCFMAAGGNVPQSTVRTIYSAMWQQESLENSGGKGSGKLEWYGPGSLDCDPSILTFSIRGNGFLYNMVRIIVGTLVDIGLGKIDPDEMKAIILGKDRQRAGHTAPACGLYLAEVYFEEDLII